MPGQGELEGGKRHPPTPRTGPSAFKDSAISERSSSESEGAWPFSPPAQPQCLPSLLQEEGWRGAGRGDYRDEPWTQWCFRAESSRSSSARSIPSPTVTAGTRLGPSEHIICARMAVKRRALRLSTHPTPRHCCVCHLSVHHRSFSGSGAVAVAEESVWRLDQPQNKLKDRQLPYTFRQADVFSQRCRRGESYRSTAQNPSHGFELLCNGCII